MATNDAVVDVLARVDGFDSLDRDELDAIVACSEERSYAAGEFILRRGETGDAMHVILEGKVLVLVGLPQGEDLQSIVPLGVGDIFGEMALLTREERVADVVAEGDVRTLCVSRDNLEPLLLAQPELAKPLTEILASRLAEDGGPKRIGRYELKGRLGKGATARVYMGVHEVLDRVVAIKMLSHTLAYDTEFRARFLQEARTIAGLTHPRIVQVYDAQEALGTLAIIMEYVPGRDLSQLLARQVRMEAPDAARVLADLAEALEYAHGRGIVHRDVKPANCVVDDRGRAKLMDFGIARRIQPKATDKREAMVEGTPNYLSPEAAVGRVVDGRGDIYALGVTAFEMVSGHLPFSSKTIRGMLLAHVHEAPPDPAQHVGRGAKGLVEFIRGALIKDPEKRLSNWKRIRELLLEDAAPPDPSAMRYADLWSIRYSKAASRAVDSATRRFAAELLAIAGVKAELGRRVDLTADQSTWTEPNSDTMRLDPLGPAPIDHGDGS